MNRRSACGVAIVVAMLSASFAWQRHPRGVQAAIPDPPPARIGAPAQAEPTRVALGRALFFDTTLSEPPGTSCASCHDPKQAFAGDNGSDLGTARGSRTGHYARRNTPSLLYLRFVRRMHMIWDDDSDVPEAFGGFFWDGRADSLSELVRQPMLHPDEMGNRSVKQVVGKIAHADYAAGLRAEFDDAFASDEQTMLAIGLCLEAYLTSPALSPFSSAYDDYVRGTTALSAREEQGLALFRDMDKGACSACHRLDPSSGLPESSLFSDYGYDVVAVPRNRALPHNRDAQRFDLGLCERKDPRMHTDDPWFCGAFRTPSLRNVALRRHYMHNGVFSSLHEVVRFYATRSAAPTRWYGARKFDDLPQRHHENVNVDMPPYNQPEGETPRLGEDEIDAIVTFLHTLTDRQLPDVTLGAHGHPPTASKVSP
jgi:cytochrome c peroxidase